MRRLDSIPVKQNGKDISIFSLSSGDLVRVHLVDGLGEGKVHFIHGMLSQLKHGIVGIQTTLSYRPVMGEWIDHIEVLYKQH